jgi:hypothetical protein
MDAWDSLLGMLFLFPPIAIFVAACGVKLVVLLNESTITWSKALLIGVGINVTSIVLYLLIS